MKIFGKPVNRWGWARVSAYMVLGCIVAWILGAAVLRNAGEVSWMKWSGYQTFLLQKGLDLAIIPLLAALLAGWLEEQAYQKETDLATHRETEHTLAVQRKEVLKRFHEAVQAVLPGAEPDLAEIPVQSRLELAEMARAALKELDGKGKGDLLHFLFERKLVSGENPVVALHDADLSGAVLTHAHLHGICLEGVDLSGAQMNRAHLVKGRLSRATLSRAQLRHADLKEALLNGSSFAGARLDGANLEGADLREACLDDAFLIGTNLKHCLLDGFPAGETAPAQLEKSPLDQAILVDTILPDGRKVTNENGRQYLRDKELSMLVDKL